MLKFVSIAILTLNTFNPAIAQIKKGSIFLGGNVGGSSLKVTKDGQVVSNQVGFEFSPVYGEAIKDNLFIGAALLFSTTKEEFTLSSTIQHQEYYGAGVFRRKYYQIKASPLYLFVEERLSFQYSPFIQTQTLGSKENRRDYTFKLGAAPGVSYALTDKLHIESGFNDLISIGYHHEKKDQISPTSTTTFITNNLYVSGSLNNIANFYIGFRLLISQ